MENKCSRGKKIIDSLTPENSGQWGKLCSVVNPRDADYYVICGDRDVGLANNKNVIVLPCEPPCIQPHQKYLNNKYQYSHKFSYKNMYHTINNLDLIGRNLPTNNFDYWRNLKYQDITKEKNVSVIVSGKTMTKLQRDRLNFVQKLIDSDLDIDVYGRNPIKHDKYIGRIDGKCDGLFKYNYSICVENCSIENYFTEKITDALLCWSTPIYYGCTNLDQYFPEHSYYYIDIYQPDVLEQILNIISRPITSENITAMNIARNKILYEYNIWPTIEKILNC